MEVGNPNSYPMSLSVDYPEKLNRLTTFFRLFTAIPIGIIIWLLAGGSSQWGGGGVWTYQYAAASIVFLPIILMLLFRQKYPKWWFDWNVALIKFSTRVEAYLALLRDEYPSTDELFFLGIAAIVSIIIAWFAILFTGRYPRGLFDFVVGVFRWCLRVVAYAFLLTTDRYPPFALSD